MGLLPPEPPMELWNDRYREERKKYIRSEQRIILVGIFSIGVIMIGFITLMILLATGVVG